MYPLKSLSNCFQICQMKKHDVYREVLKDTHGNDYYRIWRNKRPPKISARQKQWFFKGGSTQNRWDWWMIFQRGEYAKPKAFDVFWYVFLLVLKIKPPGRLFRQIRCMTYLQSAKFSLRSSVRMEMHFFMLKEVFGPIDIGTRFYRTARWRFNNRSNKY